jgi:hypothetical protein
MHDLVVILIIISIHCISDYMSEHPRYECPEICEVDHVHLTKEKEDVRKNGSTSPEGQQGRNSRLHKPEGGHPTDWRKD